MTLTVPANYRRIDLKFLDHNGTDHFDIFYKTKVFGKTKFVKYASSKKEHQEKVYRLLESEEKTIDFYIIEEDLFKYYNHATKTLRKIVSNPKLPFEIKAKKVYDVSKNIMKEFFENNASDKVLVCSGEVMEMMEDCFKDTDVGFYGISKITNKDYYTYTHSVNVGLYCMTYGIKTNMKPDDIKLLGLGGLLHDVGKSKISNEILNKKGRLSPNEFSTIKKHAPIGKEILSGMNCFGHSIIDMVAQHHENYSGTGYPQGLKGDEISPFARICRVMDVYDALTTRRSYKKAMDPYDTLTLMRKQMLDDFDKSVLDHFIKFMGPE